jgi:drug/metabolite transporter (DMT)-like permease
MNAGYLYMIAGLLSFSMLGVFHKLGDVMRCRPSALNALIYGWALLFSLLLAVLLEGKARNAPAIVIWIGIPFGIAASIAILALQTAIRHGGIATSWLAINLSSGIPTVASIFIYGEPLNTQKSLALLLIPLSMTLLWVDRRRNERRLGEHEAALPTAMSGKDTE